MSKENAKVLLVKPENRLRDPVEDKVLYFVVNTILIIFSLIVLYPLIYILSSSFSSPIDVAAGRVVFLPVNPSVDGYRAVFSHRHIGIGYRNTIFYTVVGTAINIAMTLIAAYPLSRKDMPFRGFFMFLFTFTMFFGGGLVPTYILMTQIKFINTIWVMLIPGALSVYNMILVRTFIQSSIPGELLEASMIDGCSDTKYFFIMVLPLSKAVIAVVTLFYAVGHWNSYFTAMIYLNQLELYPLQIILRNILIANQVQLNEIVDAELLVRKQGMADLLKHSLIVVSTAPIMCVYPFIQKYFVKGVMLGSIKG
ncbi:MAG: carbohydrate ABC transporter permease [Clostridiales bacterium]|nr:carbohydrate ABC transporter permease [Clostridiales bacterium]